MTAAPRAGSDGGAAPARRLIAEVRRDPSLAEYVMTATATIPDRGFAVATIRAHPTVLADEGDHLGGEDLAPNPAEYLLAAVAMCQVVTYRSVARSLGIPIDRLEITATGTMDWRGMLGLDRSIPPGFRSIECTARIESPADPDRIRRLADRVRRYCGVSDTIRRPVDLTESLLLNGRPLAAEDPPNA